MNYSIRHRLLRFGYYSGFCISYINYFSKSGARVRGSNIYFETLRELKKQEQLISPGVYLESSLDTGRPLLKMLTKRVGGSFYSLPVYLSRTQGFLVSLRWLKEVVLANKNKPLIPKLVFELKLLKAQRGFVIRQRDLLHRQGASQRGFIYFLKKKKRKRKRLH